MRNINRLMAAWLGFGCIVSATPAFSQSGWELGPETKAYVYCSWMSGPSEKSMTQIEEITWRDGIYVGDGTRRIERHSGEYITSLERQFEQELGTETAGCEWAKSPTRYPWSYQPGDTYAGYRNQPVTAVLSKVDPEWFMIERLSDNLRVASLATAGKSAETKKPAKGRTNKGAKAVTHAPALPGLVIEKAGASLTEIAAARAKQELELARAEAAAKAKIAALKARQDAEYQAAMTKFFAERCANAGTSSDPAPAFPFDHFH
jgi:hypothetical protein